MEDYILIREDWYESELVQELENLEKGYMLNLLFIKLLLFAKKKNNAIKEEDLKLEFIRDYYELSRLLNYLENKEIIERKDNQIFQVTCNL